MNDSRVTAASTPAEDDWSGAETTNGSTSVMPMSPGNVTYTLSCTGNGTAISKQVSIVVGVPSNLTISSGPLPNGSVGTSYGTLHMVKSVEGPMLSGTFFKLE